MFDEFKFAIGTVVKHRGSWEQAVVVAQMIVKTQTGGHRSYELRNGRATYWAYEIELELGKSD